MSSYELSDYITYIASYKKNHVQTCRIRIIVFNFNPTCLIIVLSCRVIFVLFNPNPATSCKVLVSCQKFGNSHP